MTDVGLHFRYSGKYMDCIKVFGFLWNNGNLYDYWRKKMSLGFSNIEKVENNSDHNQKDHLISDSMILDIIMRNSQDTIYFKDRDSKFIANSRAHADQFHLENPKEMLGKSDFDFFPTEFAMLAYLDEKKIMETGIPILGKQEKLIKENGECVWFSASKYPIYGNNGEIIGTWGTSRDITALKQAQEELRQLNEKLENNNVELQKLSDLDGLSDLYNQRKFYEILEKTIEIYKQKQKSERKESFCILMIDIDEFKKINDSFGHPAGDRAIRFIADIIRNNKRQDDVCFRCGGDEFAMILLETGIKSARYAAERLRKIIEGSSFFYHNNEIRLTISAGVKEFEMEDTTYAILDKVDKSLYISKNNGKNQVN